jgi:hypothetical protein
MSIRSCQLWLLIKKGDDRKRYAVSPVPSANLPPDVCIGFRLLKQPDPQTGLSEIYIAGLRGDGSLWCTCPSAEPGGCKHCRALLAAGVLPLRFVEILNEQRRLLDAAEAERAEALRRVEALTPSAITQHDGPAPHPPARPARRRRKAA